MEPIRPVEAPEGKPPKTHPRRYCAEDACGTVLSRYNPDTRCYLHAPRRYPRIRGRPRP